MKVSLIIPVYNEENTVAVVLLRVARAELPPGFSSEIIVVDDFSSDGSAKKISRLKSRLRLKVISHARNRGKGAAVRSGLQLAVGDLVLIQDADLEYDPKYYYRLLDRFSSPDVDVVYGSRLVNYPLKLWGSTKTPLPLHLVANKFLTLLTNWLYGQAVTDMETGYKVIRKKLLDQLELSANRFDFEPELTAQILKRGIKITEVPIKVKPRGYHEGKKISWVDGLVAIWTLVRHRFKD